MMFRLAFAGLLLVVVVGLGVMLFCSDGSDSDVQTLQQTIQYGHDCIPKDDC